MVGNRCAGQTSQLRTPAGQVGVAAYLGGAQCIELKGQCAKLNSILWLKKKKSILGVTQRYSLYSNVTLLTIVFIFLFDLLIKIGFMLKMYF